MSVKTKPVTASMFAIFNAARFMKKAERIVSKGLALALALVNSFESNSSNLPLNRYHYLFIIIIITLSTFAVKICCNKTGSQKYISSSIANFLGPLTIHDERSFWELENKLKFVLDIHRISSLIFII